MRLGAIVAIFVSLGLSAQAAAPEDEYWRARLEAIAKLRALAAEKAAPEVVANVEAVALDALRRKIVEIVGPVRVEGFADQPRSLVERLSDGPRFGRLDAVEFLAADPQQGASLVVTTRTLLRLWLKEASERAREGGAGALTSDALYGEALNLEHGFFSVVDIALKRPEGVAFAGAKLGRGEGADASPQLVVTVVKGKRVFVALEPLGGDSLEVAECPAPGEESRGRWGDAWRKCERLHLPGKPAFARWKQQAQQIGERLARAK